MDATLIDNADYLHCGTPERIQPRIYNSPDFQRAHDTCDRRGRRCQLDSWVRKIPWRRKCQPTLLLWPGKSHGQRRLVGYSPGGSLRVWHDWTTEHTHTKDMTATHSCRFFMSYSYVKLAHEIATFGAFIILSLQSQSILKGFELKPTKFIRL